MWLVDRLLGILHRGIYNNNDVISSEKNHPAEKIRGKKFMKPLRENDKVKRTETEKATWIKIIKEIKDSKIQFSSYLKRRLGTYTI